MLDTIAGQQVLDDYAIVRDAVEFLSARRREPPSMGEVAKNARLSPARLEQVLSGGRV